MNETPWIKTSERLPSDDSLCWVYGHECGVWLGRYCYNHKGVLQWLDNEYDSFEFIVTHWMPFSTPLPPSE